jgi:hypothetical protein
MKAVTICRGTAPRDIPLGGRAAVAEQLVPRHALKLCGGGGEPSGGIVQGESYAPNTFAICVRIGMRCNVALQRSADELEMQLNLLTPNGSVMVDDTAGEVTPFPSSRREGGAIPCPAEWRPRDYGYNEFAMR